MLLFLYLLLWTRQATRGLEAHALFIRLDPLAGIAAMLGGRAWIPGMALGLLTIVLALVAGRAWCGWVCPMGTLLDIIPSRRSRAASADVPSPWRSVKYGVLALIVIGAAAGSLTLIVLDPITLLLRSMAAVVLPAIDGAVKAIEIALYPVRALQAPIVAVDTFLRRTVLPAQPAFYVANVAVGVLFALVLAANAIRRRFWCRYLCPLGALLALISRVSVLRHRVDADRCIQCGRCARLCPTGAIAPERAFAADVAECTACLGCAAACPTGAISFQPKLGLVGPQRYDPSRRQVFALLGIAAVGVGLLKVARALGVPDGWLLRPPGATDSELLGRCIRCGQCLKVCPTGALQPSLTTAGPDALWTPVLVPRHGYCDYGCASCGQACPTGAIPRLALDVKRQMVMGLAVVDRTRCLAWAKQQNCIICEEMCPVPSKAVRLDDIEITDAQGNTITLHRPVVNERHCIGCGACEFHCPVEGAAAIRVVYSPLAGQPTRHGGGGRGEGS